MQFNDFLYHSTEVFLCDIKLVFLKACIAFRTQRIAARSKQIAALEAQLIAAR